MKERKRRFLVNYIEFGMLQFRWYYRKCDALALAQKLERMGLNPIISEQ